MSHEPAPLPQAELLASLPPEWPEDPRPGVERRVRTMGRKVVVLDDDPTGTQTVHDLWVLTRWTPEALRSALADDRPVFYILTNSRSLPQEDAVAVNVEIAENLASAAEEVGCELDVVSRSDSTLRGHYPAEVDALQSTLESRLGCSYDGTLICPFFLEGGRLTAHDVHWVSEGERLIPAAQTEYARDVTFGYTHSNLREWVQQKTRGRVAASEVLSISLTLIREQGPKGVYRTLFRMADHRVGIVNAVSYRDMAIFVDGLLQAEAQGKRFLFRTAASFVKARGAIPDRALLSHAEMLGTRPGKGLIVVGSYVDKTTRQLERALGLPKLCPIELHVREVLDPASREHEIRRAAEAANQALMEGEEALVYTSRERLTQRGRAGELGIGELVSSALVKVVRQVTAVPQFIVAKGGITSSDVATKGLDVGRAWILGQILPGVPVWRLEEGSRFPGLPYVVFPGNVGDDGSLAQAIEILRD